MTTVGERIKQRRKVLHISADLIADKLGVSRSTIFRYENGDIDKVPISVISEIAKILHTTPQFLMGWSNNNNSSSDINNQELEQSNVKPSEISSEESDHILIIRQLDQNRKHKVYTYAQNQLKEQDGVINLVDHINEDSNTYTDVTIYGAASAGVGEVLMDEEHNVVSYHGHVPAHDYALLVNGDSMEPLFADQQIIFVKSATEAYSGQIIIGYLNGKAYVKKFWCQDNKCELISLNPKYEPIEITKDDEFEIHGIVIL
ncbi:helix-turn-helix domain-containing protein [Lapidilactobacillus wuchangensis]|uniref:helix-turn-helix domain-containing protein n=1 Tax=Lapidilactobacillus wuchangensis TaxID=2486001 RepID=UPI000F766A7B|nr:XRE family transcriptional regulator [Lapidilactobacillus wuchangensis]